MVCAEESATPGSRLGMWAQPKALTVPPAVQVTSAALGPARLRRRWMNVCWMSKCGNAGINEETRKREVARWSVAP